MGMHCRLDALANRSAFCLCSLMPDPRLSGNRHDLPLDEALGFVTHVAIRCTPPSCNKPCGHRAIWLTSELYAKLPRCRTYRQFTERLRCSRCGARGWLVIEPAGR